MTRTSTSLAILLWAGAAAADPAADARAKFAEGRERFRHRDYAAARAAFEEANRILPNPRVWGNIAACYEGEDNAAAVRRVFSGETGPLADVTALNAGAALYVGGIAETLEEGVERAREAIVSGAAAAKLEELRSFSG